MSENRWPEDDDEQRLEEWLELVAERAGRAWSDVDGPTFRRVLGSDDSQALPLPGI